MAYIAHQSSTATDTIDKGVDKGALAMMLDVLQNYQYEQPVPSSLRELISNGIDAGKEKNSAIAILEGSLKVEDVYVQGVADGDGLYKDSKWDPDYYDPQWLSNDNTVQVEYHKRENERMDQVIIRDQGVGLRPSDRLPGYLQLGYSTKRLNRILIGKFGLGAKAPLSIGIPFFTVTNFYNGWEYRLNVYSATVENILPDKFINENGELVNTEIYILRANGKDHVIRRMPTAHQNGLEVSFDIKKTLYQKVVDGVKSQVMYFPQVKFRTYTHKMNGDVTFDDHDITANVIVQNESFIVSDQNYHTQPHTVMGGMNYGLLNWDELELERKFGALGIIVDASSVDVTPSRERLIYNEKTIATIHRQLDAAKHIANDLIKGELTFTNIRDWYNTARAVSNAKFIEHSKVGKVMAALRDIVDKETVRANVELPCGTYTIAEVLSVFQIREVINGGTYSRGSTATNKVTRQAPTRDVDWTKTYWMGDNIATPNKDWYLLEQNGWEPHYLVEMSLEEELRLAEEPPMWRAKNEAAMVLLGKVWNYDEAARAKRIALCEWISRELAAACEYKYGNVTVPTAKEKEAVKVRDDEDIKKEEDAAIKAEKEARRAMLDAGETIIVRHPFVHGTPTIKTAWLKDINHREVYYGNKNDAEALAIAGNIIDEQADSEKFEVEQPGYNEWGALPHDLLPTHSLNLLSKLVSTIRIRAIGNDGRKLSWYHERYNASEFQPCILFQVANANVKHMKGFRHINEFFVRLEHKTVTMADALVRWNTARLMKKKLDEYKDIPLAALVQLPQLQVKLEMMRKYISANWSASPKMDESGFITLLDRLGTLQKFIEDNPEDLETAGAMVKELTSMDGDNVFVVHGNMLRGTDDLLPVLSELKILRWMDANHASNDEFQNDLANFISVKGLRDID